METLYFFMTRSKQTARDTDEEYTEAFGLREVADIDEAERLAFEHNYDVYLGLPYLAGLLARGWFVVAAHTAEEADSQAAMIVSGTHPDQHDTEYDHALIRAGLRGPFGSPALKPQGTRP